jgi:hypothetical protein
VAATTRRRCFGSRSADVVPGSGDDVAKAIARTATVGTPMPLALFADDDALYSTGANGPMNNPAPPVNVTISKYRGPGKVTVADARPKFEAIKGGKAMEPYTGKSANRRHLQRAGRVSVARHRQRLFRQRRRRLGLLLDQRAVEVTVSGARRASISHPSAA